MFVNNETLYNEVLEVKKMLSLLLHKSNEFSIEEVSLYKASSLLKMGNDKIIKHVKDNELKARIYRDSKGKIRYRFRLADIRNFQENQTIINFKPIEIENAEDICNKIFNK